VSSADARYDRAAQAQWLFVLGRSFAAAVEASAPKHVVDALWWLAGTEFATLESVVGAFPLNGDDEVRSFAVASFGEFAAGASETTVTAVIRGSACIDIFSVGGARRFRSEGVQPWVLADFRSVTGLTLCSESWPTTPVAAASAASLPLGLGVVAGDAFVWSLSPIEAAEPFLPAGSSASTRRETGQASEPGAAATEAESANPAASIPVSSAEEPATSRVVDPHDLDDDTIIAAHRRHSAEIDPVPPGHSPSLFGSAVAADAAGERAATPTFATPRTIPPVPPARPEMTSEVAPADGAAEHPTFRVRISGRETLELDVPIIFGRNPSPARIEPGRPPRLVRVQSPELVVSSTHVEVEQVGDAVVATDLRSTNGTFVRIPGRQRERLHPGESRVLLPGATLEIGDGNIIEITDETSPTSIVDMPAPTARGRA
jgi:FHA domain